MKIFIFIGLLGLIFSCNNNNATKVEDRQQNNASIPLTLSDSLYKEVMKGHDSGMLYMGPMMKYKALLKQQMDSLATVKTKNADLLKKLAAVSDSLNSADEMMNDWMREFDPEKAGKTEADKVAFFKAEKEKVDNVKAKISSSIQQAELILGNK